MAAEGPGFVTWERPAGADLRYWSALALQGSAPSPSAADELARRLEDKVWCTIEDARSAAECRLLSVPLDLNALIPVPWKILRKGWHAAGSDCCWEHWGTRWPLRKVTFRFEHRRKRVSTGIEVVAVYEFLSGDRSPWNALSGIRSRWPIVAFTLQPDHTGLQIVERQHSQAA